MTLSENQTIFLKLVLRSSDAGDGWRNVSRVVWNVIKEQAESLPDLIEIDKDTFRLRLTKEGQIVVRYLV